MPGIGVTITAPTTSGSTPSTINTDARTRKSQGRRQDFRGGVSASSRTQLATPTAWKAWPFICACMQRRGGPASKPRV